MGDLLFSRTLVIRLTAWHQRRPVIDVAFGPSLAKWGGLVGGRGHREGQLRVVSSPSPPAHRTKEPRTGGAPGGRGVRGPDFFFAKAPWVLPPGAG
jgi:hypothetical protein